MHRIPPRGVRPVPRRAPSGGQPSGRRSRLRERRAPCIEIGRRPLRVDHKPPLRSSMSFPPMGARPRHPGAPDPRAGSPRPDEASRDPMHLRRADAPRPRGIRPARRGLRSALEQAEVLGLFDLDAISDVIRRNEGRRGVRRLRSSLAAMTAGGAELRSEFERPVPADLTVRRAGRAAEQSRHPAARRIDRGRLLLARSSSGRRVRRLRFHRDRRAFRNDRRRDRRLAAIGIHCLRYVWEDLVDRDAIRRELLEVVASRPTPESRAGRNATPRRVSDVSR